MASSKTGLKGWSLLHSELPSEALKPLSTSVYGVSGLTDVNEGYLIERLHQSELAWSWVIEETQYLGKEERKGQNGPYSVFLAAARGTLQIETAPGSGLFRSYSGSGGSDNRKLDAAIKGAGTVAFKQACKLAGLTLSVYKDGKAVDIVYTDADGNTTTGHVGDERAEPKGAGQSANAHPEAKANAAAADAKAEEEKKSKSPITPEQQKTLVSLINSLPSAEQPEPPVTGTRIGAYIKQVETRTPGKGFEAALAKLVAIHTDECGPECAHVTVALASDGALQANQAA